MKILRNLKFDIDDKPGMQPGITQRGITINISSGRGFVRHLQLTTDFVVLRRNDKIVAIDIQDFVKIAEQVEPSLTPPEQSKVTELNHQPDAIS